MRFQKSWLAIVFVLLGSFTSSLVSATPNIVFLLIDDMGWPDVACYGHEYHETPTIDQLAADGLKFTDFYAASPVCSSTRASIQSGQYSARVGITDFIPGHWRPFEQLVVPPIENSLPQGIKTPGDVLKSAGYTTGYFGKWHLGNAESQGPQHRGYDFYAGNLGEDFRRSRAGKSPGPKKIDLLTDQTMWFIEKNKDKPFFVTLSHHAVHIRVEANQETITKYRFKPKPVDGVNHTGYAAMVEDLDRSIDRILKKLDELDLAKNTIVVFTSDNGGLRKIYTGVGEEVSTNAPLRDEKGTVYEGGIRVPMIVRWPGVIRPGTVSDEPATTADLLPTFAELAEAKLPEQPIDGTSLVSVFREPAAELGRDAIYFHYPHYHHSEPTGAIRSGKWKLIEHFDDGELELYDLESDLSEANNLVESEKETASRLQNMLAKWRIDVNARMPSKNPKFDAQRRKEWWSRRTNQPLDIERMRRQYESRDK